MGWLVAVCFTSIYLLSERCVSCVLLTLNLSALSNIDRCAAFCVCSCVCDWTYLRTRECSLLSQCRVNSVWCVASALTRRGSRMESLLQHAPRPAGIASGTKVTHYWPHREGEGTCGKLVCVCIEVSMWARVLACVCILSFSRFFAGWGQGLFPWFPWFLWGRLVIGGP